MIEEEFTLDENTFHDQEPGNNNASIDKSLGSDLPEDEIIEFDDVQPASFKRLIKVIGVGGGGSNAVTNMYKEGINDVSFIICNTDRQALALSPVPIKVQLGKSLTQGLGAGNDPRMGREAAKESLKEIESILKDGTQMVFITAGMGGGTGTGAAPIIAELAKKMNILTVGIVTLPFRFEGLKRLKQAVEGIQELKKNLDALLLIDNERIKEVYGDSPAMEAFKRADQILTIAAKGIADIITHEGAINVDFADVRNVLRDSGIAIMGTGYGEGENRAIDAANKAIHSPLLNFQDIRGAKKLLFFISYHSESPALTNEIDLVAQYIQDETKNIPDTIWGHGIDNKLKPGQFAVTIIATGFESNIDDYLDKMLKDFSRLSQTITQSLSQEEEEEPQASGPLFEQAQEKQIKKEASFNLSDSYTNEEEISDIVNHFEHKPLHYETIEDIRRLEEEPAYRRFGYSVVTKTTSIEKPKLISLTQNPL